jgi:hypothetical protein
VHGVFVNGVRVFDGGDYVRLGKGPGQVLDRFLPARAALLANAAQPRAISDRAETPMQ